MTLHARISRFFLATLAIVLFGFSTLLYAVSARYLHRRTEDRVESILNTLAAAAEITPGGVEWEPEERSLSFGRRAPEGGFQWTVSDERGAAIDGSTPRTILARDDPDRSLDGRRAFRMKDERGLGWAVGVRVLAPETAGFPAAPGLAPDIHPALILRAAVATADVEVALRNLSLFLAGASIGVWVPAFLAGRRLVRRALLPLTEMALAAHEIRGDDLAMRLPTPATGDELEELGGSFNALLGRLQESFERQRRFTGDASHQLRTPLTAIQGQVDLALRRDREPEEYRRTLELVRRKTQHLRRIVEALLFLARADRESSEPALQVVDLAEWLPEHLHAWREPPRAAEIRLETSGEPPMAVAAHVALLAEMVDNLVDNATRHGRSGTPVAVGLARRGGRIELTVEDRGPGVSAADLPHLFEPFYQTEGARSRGAGGVGLGLSIVKRLAEVFGATVAVASEPGRGARFLVRFPEAANEAATNAESSPATTA
ncbi:sensor histidine kinase [Planctomyces sp. SH-PL62]|uniref:sensor histidine kinase n=1 Tax=Planctomyces sp. SH-PL62 TaxID=1636152 RepID=UPI00078D4CE4|nr:ATP-binding protein [Planctomyces sp. SH-PL62]AMV39733.1 Signal transduction histidine-protein kinase ArlS [Planctomyces sp. SH-PL62]